MVDSLSMTGTRTWRVWPLLLPLAALILLAAISSPSAHAADPTPVLVFQYPAEGATLTAEPFFFQLCFASPINKKDLPLGGDFFFSVTEPDGVGLGNRDVFQPDAYGIAVYPGVAMGDVAGQWKFHWRVSSPDAQSPLEGDINFTVNPGGDPIPTATPPPCIGEAGTGTVTPTPEGNPPTDSPPPGTGATLHPTNSAKPTASTAAIDEDDSPDIDKYAYLTIGAAGGAAIIATLGYIFRRRIGYDPHKPPDSDDSGHH
jgi:methionine-rich copper-binding protein CopC